MAEIDVQVSCDADNGYGRADGSFSPGPNSLRIGNYTGVANNAWYRFTGITIPQGSDISVAYIETYEYVSNSSALTKIYAEDINDPVVPVDSPDLFNKTHTNNGIDWDGDPGGYGFHQSPSIVPVIQELVTNYGYSNQAIQILHDDDGSPGEKYQRFYVYGEDPDRGPKLHIEYTPAGAIDIGAEAIDRVLHISFMPRTVINKENPANASGIIDTVKIFAVVDKDLANCKVGTFYTTNGNMLKCRDSVTIGSVTGGSEQTFPGLSIAVQVGDYIGICADFGGQIEKDITGYAGIWITDGDFTTPGDEYEYAFTASAAISLKGTGTEEEPSAYYHGLKVQGVGELALCDAGVNPLRIRKGGVTYGVELVDVSDPNASPLRIKTPAGIKAIRRYT